MSLSRDIKLPLPKNELWWPTIALLFGLLVLLPRLGSYGFWDPQEIKVADQAKQLLDGQELKDVVKDAPPFTVQAVADSIDRIGVGERQARLPLALLGLLAIAASFAIGRQLGNSARAGLIASFVTMCSPLLIFESRQLTSAIGATSGGALMMLGLIGLIWPRRPRQATATSVALLHGAAPAAGLVVLFVLALLLGELLAILLCSAVAVGILLWSDDHSPTWAPWHSVACGALTAAGATAAYQTVGALLGVLVPLGAAAAATMAALWWPGELSPGHDGDDDDDALRARKLQLWITGIGLACAAVAVLGVILYATFDIFDAAPGDRALFGKSFRPVKGYVAVLGGAWRVQVPEAITWDVLFEHMLYGLFPWVALAPFALGRAATGRATRRATWGGHLVFGWAFLAWAIGTVVAIKVGPVHYVAIPAVAVAIGMWLDDLMVARETDGARAALARQLPMAGLFVLLVALMLGKDLKGAPEKLASLHLATDIKWPDGVSGLKRLPLLLGALFALPMWAALWRPGIPQKTEGDTPLVALVRTIGRRIAIGFDWLGRCGVMVAIGSSLLLALALAMLWTPSLSKQFSYKNLFDRYHELSSPGDELGVLGMPGSGPDYYAKGAHRTLGNRSDLIEFFQADPRRFALAPRSGLCALHQSSTSQGFEYYVVDDSNDKFLLFTNQLARPQDDRNPLPKLIMRQEPTQLIKERVSVNYDNKIELVGVNMPSQVKRGEDFELILIYHVLTKPRRNWQVFAHFDGAGTRFQGDHWPLKEEGCGTAQWQEGDYIVDRTTVTAGNVTYGTGTYTLHTGLFTGSAGNWTNMTIVEGPKDDNNRAKVSAIKVH